MKHYPARVDHTPGKPTLYIALCGYSSANPSDFCRPEKPEKITCSACRDYDRQKSAEEWTINTLIPEDK